jgi:ankyrin repeat protein
MIELLGFGFDWRREERRGCCSPLFNDTKWEVLMMTIMNTRGSSPILAAVFVWMVAMWCVPLSAEPTETIVLFSAKGAIQQDASLEIREDIVVTVAGDTIQNTFCRELPTARSHYTGVTIHPSYSVRKTLLDGREIPYTLEEEERALRVCLGDPAVTLSHGEHTFTLVYITDGWVDVSDREGRIVWEVTGRDAWPIPVAKAVFFLSLPGEASFSSVDFSTGRWSATRAWRGERNAELLPDGSVATTLTLPVGEGLSVAYTWPPEVVSHPDWRKFGRSVRDAVFIELCRRAVPDHIEFLIMSGANINAFNSLGSPLENASSENPHPGALGVLIEAGADIHAMDRHGRNALMYAAGKNTPEVVSFLLEKGADARIKNEEGISPVRLAAMYNRNPAVLKTLIAAGASVDELAPDGSTLLFDASRSNTNPDIVDFLLDAGLDVNARNEHAIVSLHLAAGFNGNPDVLKRLLLARPELEVRDKEFGMTPLIVASNFSGSPEILALLLESGADVNAVDKAGMRAVDYAKENRYLNGSEVYERLLEASR